MRKLSEALSPDTSKTFQKTEPYFRRCTHMHQIFATRAACQIVGDWLPASIRGHAEFFKHESANMNQKQCTNNQNLSPQTCRQLKKTKAPVPDQQSSTSWSPDAHIMASLLFITALVTALRGGGFRNSRGQTTCRETIKKTVSNKKNRTLQPMNSPRPGKSPDHNLCH